MPKRKLTPNNRAPLDNIVEGLIIGMALALGVGIFLELVDIIKKLDSIIAILGKAVK